MVDGFGQCIGDRMTKTIEENFRDWEASTFGFGYGTGEPHIIPAVKTFLELCNEGSGASYDYKKLEAALAPAVAWLLINVVARSEITEYGTSPRYAWLTRRGLALRDFVSSKSAGDLIEIATNYTEDYTHCYPNACNCGPNGYVAGAVCPNPFWQKLR